MGKVLAEARGRPEGIDCATSRRRAAAWPA
jgi:hypothetical protein